MFKRILFACDFSAASQMAFHLGLDLSRKCEAEVHVVNVITTSEAKHYFAAEGMGIDHLRLFQEQKMIDLFGSEPGTVTQWEILTGDSVSKAIVRYAQSNGCELIVTGIHGRSVLTSMAEEIAGTTGVPVMMIREPVYSETQALQFDRILVPIDFFDSSLEALFLAVQIANFMGSELHVVHVVDRTARRHPEDSYAWLHPTGYSREGIAAAVQRGMRQMLEKQNRTADVRLTVLFGPPVNEILQYAEEAKCTLVVAGARGEEAPEMPILGSVSRGIVAHSHIPLITVCSLTTSEIAGQERRAAAQVPV